MKQIVVLILLSLPIAAPAGVAKKPAKTKRRNELAAVFRIFPPAPANDGKAKKNAA